MVAFGSTEEEQEERMGIDPVRREPAEAIAAEFEGSLGKLLHCWSESGQTDELIDAVVYKLYQLKKEEIDIVGGREIAKSHLLQQ